MKPLPQLPILEVIPQLKKQLRLNPILLLHAPPGAGKSTIAPLELMDEPWLEGKKIIMLEPRKLAAISIAQRMAQLLGEPVGERIGYRVRFDTCVGKQTRIEVITEGILTRMMQQDNALEEVGLIIFDEFHERSIHADLGLAISRDIQQVLRPDLKLLIMSATLDSKDLSKNLQAPMVESMGKAFPVSIKYGEGNDLFTLPESISLTIKKAIADHDGDLLVFLPGQREINKTAEILSLRFPQLAIYKLYGQLAFSQQRAALSPHPEGKRKVVLATAIAETSLTIEGIKIVVDGGFMRTSRFNPSTGLNRLVTIPVTQDTATQRAGRAGRLSAGVCFRLWSKGSQERLLPFRQPEILETDLTSLALELYKWGINDPLKLSWVTPPPQGNWAQAISTLEHLGAIAKGRITTHGNALHAFPCHPRIAHLLVCSQELELEGLATDLAAVLEEKDPLSQGESLDINLRIEGLRRFRSHSSSNFNYKKIEQVAKAYRQILHKKVENTPIDPYATGMLIAQAFSERIASAKTGNQVQFQLANGKIASMDRKDDLAYEPWIAIAQMDERAGVGKIFMAAPLNPKDLNSMVKSSQRFFWNEDEATIQAIEEWKIGQIVLQKKHLQNPDKELLLQTLLNMIAQSGEKWLPFDENFKRLQHRVMSLRAWNGPETLPDFSTSELLKTANDWLSPYLTEIKSGQDLKKLPLVNILKNSFSYSQQEEINRLAPEKIVLPSGSSIPIQYSKDGEPPILAARLQELFGWAQTPKVNNGNIPLLIHLLSPGYKPVQVTQDLKSFWDNTYHEVRKELKRRYPKHHWPDNPWEAEAVKGVKRK
ncbi:ATP-dependent helicase HrpB [Cyclobacterium amurskyense]|uniref:ATP-dependent helicase HrpB n=1 Tax=Cyclobacterium amurskyense TaxID=320787 RepID=A0A0H4PEW6_9BACT|nr:ATP-dependent helicase HrpB [Cyclobacterium amurskyense]AKP53001.1 ATP-dependent helicase HrpB [Cyclobacterium amurskyense]